MSSASFGFADFDTPITDTAWWLTDCPTPGPSLWRHCQAVETKQYEHHQRLLFNALQYSNRQITAFDWGWGSQRHTSLLPEREATDSVIVPAVSTLIAEVGKTKIKARPKTKRASFKLRRASRKLDRYLYAEAKRTGLWERCKQAFEDSCWGEVGVLYFGWGDEGLTVERVFPDEFVVDNDECYSEPTPLQKMRRRCVHVESIIHDWGLDKELADRLREESRMVTVQGWVAERAPGPGWLVVVEGYRQTVGNIKGRHVIGTMNHTIVDEPWDHDWEPFVEFHFTKPVSGFYCRSAVEQAWPWQRRLDELNAAIKDAQDLACRMRIWNPPGSKISVSELTNRMGKVISSAVEPKTLEWRTNVTELYEERRRCKEECLADFGLTQMAAQGKLPQGTRLDSARAINEYAELPQNRLVDLGQRYEDFQLKCFEMLVRISELAASKNKKLKTTWVAGKRVEEIDWDDIDYSKDRYVLQIEPSSTFNESMAAHAEDIDKLVQSGVITPEEYLAQRATPDTERLIALKVAATENIFAAIESIESGKYVPPHGAQDLNSGVMLFHYHYLDLCNEYDDVPQQVKEDLILWILQAKWVMEQGAAYGAQGSEVASSGQPMPAVPGIPGDPMQAAMQGQMAGGAMPTSAPTDPAMMPAMPQVPGMQIPTAASFVPNATQL